MGRTLAAVTGITAATYLILSSMIPIRVMEDPVGPRMYPLLVGGGMLIIALLLWLESRGAVPASMPQPTSTPELRRRQRLGVLGASGAALLYALTMESVGYLAATFLLMFGMMCAFNRGRHLTNVLVAAGTAAVLYYGLKKFLGVPLPAGLFGFLG